MFKGLLLRDQGSSFEDRGWKGRWQGTTPTPQIGMLFEARERCRVHIMAVIR